MTEMYSGTEIYNGIRSLDHPVVAVKDMAGSRECYARLGFTIPPRGSHVEWGTGNWCIMFADDYLELRGILNPERFTLNLDEVLARFGEGLMGVAFGTDSAQGNADAMKANGLQPRELRQLTRNFELSESQESWVQPRFSLCFPQESEVTGLMHVVMCEHLTPELIRKPEYLQHANAVLGVREITGLIDNPDEVEQAQRRLLGNNAVKRVADNVFLTLPSGQEIHLLCAADYAKKTGELSKPSLGQPSYLGAMRLQVSDIAQTKACLTTNQVPFETRRDGSVWVAAEFGCGVVYEFSERY